MESINVLCIGDIVGKPGRDALLHFLPEIQKKHRIHFTVANVENVAGGFGITPKLYKELGKLQIEAFTSGNHIYNKKEIFTQMPQLKKLIRPLNFTKGNPGVGYRIFSCQTHKIAVINLIGRVFMQPYNCPFHIIHDALPEIQKITPIILIDFHAEATSEKQALGWFLDGKVSLVYGTHTHVITADERILDNNTGYITDIGMTGAYNSIIGMEKDVILERFLTQMPNRFEPPKNYQMQINAIKCTIDTKTGNLRHIERIQEVK